MIEKRKAPPPHVDDPPPPEANRGDESQEAEVRDLIHRARTGDDAALAGLVQRYLPVVHRWARGRLPRYARSLADTEDLVQDVMTQAVRHLGSLDYRGESALRAYLRRSLTNRIRQELRRVSRRPLRQQLSDHEASGEASPLENALENDLLAHYRTAIAKLRPREREILLARVDLACTFREIADVLDLPSEDAARKAYARAAQRLQDEMRHLCRPSSPGEGE